MNSEQLKKIIQVAVEEINKPVVEAALIGNRVSALIKKEYGTMQQLKQHHGGLVHILDSYCSDFLVFDSESGKDRRYRWLQFSEDRKDAKTVMSAFVHPLKEGHIFFHNTDHYWTVKQPEAMNSSGEFAVIAPMTMTEHQAMIRDYLNTFHPDVEDFSGRETYWEELQTFLKVDQAYKRKWLAYRIQMITQVFLARIAIAGIAEEHAYNLLDEWKFAQAAKNLDQKASGQCDKIRRAAHAAIDRMPLTELRKLSIPIEYLVD